MCRAPELPKYPPLPVRRCASFLAGPVSASPMAASASASLGMIALMTLLAGCSTPPRASSSAATVDVPAPPPAGPPASAPSPAAPATGSLAGSWSSPSCGARTYERILVLTDGGAFTATDRVSPCPPGARCVWSGIITREGTWTSADGRLALTVTSEGKGAGKPLPASLLVEGDSLAEEDGSARCAYTRR